MTLSDSTIICGRVHEYVCENCRVIRSTYSPTKMFCDMPACQEAKRVRNKLLSRKRHAKLKQRSKS